MLKIVKKSSVLYSFNQQFERTDRCVADHIVNGVPTIAGVSLLDLVYECVRRVDAAPKRHCFEKVRFARAIRVNADRTSVGVNLTVGADRRTRFDVLDEHNNVCCTGWLGYATDDGGQDLPAASGAIGGRLLMGREDIEAYFIRRGSTYGRTFQSLDSLWVDEGDVLATILPQHGNQLCVSGSKIHPTIVEAALQSVIGIIEVLGLSHCDDESFIPFYIEELMYFTSSSEEECYFSRVEFVEELEKIRLLVFDIVVFDRLQRRVMQISRFCLKRL